MANIFYLSEYQNDTCSDLEEFFDLPSIEDIIEDRDALIHLGEDAQQILQSGFAHRKQLIRSRAITLLSELFPNQNTYEDFKTTLLDKREKPIIRFHVARHMIGTDDEKQAIIDELLCSRGCNDRIVASILMGQVQESRNLFSLKTLLDDSNDCVKIAAFLSLMKYPMASLIQPLKTFMKGATCFQLKLLEKNIVFYQHAPLYEIVLEVFATMMDRLKASKVRFHPGYYEKSYSREKLSKLDWLSDPQEYNHSEAFGFFES